MNCTWCSQTQFLGTLEFFTRTLYSNTNARTQVRLATGVARTLDCISDCGVVQQSGYLGLQKFHVQRENVENKCYLCPARDVRGVRARSSRPARHSITNTQTPTLEHRYLMQMRTSPKSLVKVLGIDHALSQDIKGDLRTLHDLLTISDHQFKRIFEF